MGSRIEDGYVAVVAAHFSLRERRSKVGDPIVRCGDEIDCVFASGANVAEGIAAARIRSNGVEWPGAVWSDSVQNDPRAAYRIHPMRAGTYDSSRHSLGS